MRTGGVDCESCLNTSHKKKYEKTKELKILKFFEENLINCDIIYNKSVGTECNEKRFYPDFRIDCNFFILIIEVDENKHRGSQYECDVQRMYDIVCELGISCVFLRYNPDSHNSDEKKLLDRVRYYLQFKNECDITNIVGKYGIKIEYLFYCREDDVNNDTNIESVVFNDLNQNNTNDVKNNIIIDDKNTIDTDNKSDIKEKNTTTKKNTKILVKPKKKVDANETVKKELDINIDNNTNNIINEVDIKKETVNVNDNNKVVDDDAPKVIKKKVVKKIIVKGKKKILENKSDECNTTNTL